MAAGFVEVASVEAADAGARVLAGHFRRSRHLPDFLLRTVNFASSEGRAIG
jgi:hypothetical protein